MQGKILDVLRKAKAYVSGEELSAQHNISRQGLWKHIQSLKDAGYEIEAVPHLGYRLISSPDRLFPSEISQNLKTKHIGRKIYYFDSVGSTMDVAEELGLKSAPEGTVIISETQTKGRGRMQRHWVSPKYKGLYFSLLLRPIIPPQATPIVTLLAAVSVCRTIREKYGVPAAIKWPNDVMINGKKVGGILTELQAETDAVKFVVIGIGVNLNTERGSLAEGATSLREQTREPVNRVMFLQELLQRFEALYEDFKRHGSKRILEAWRECAVTLGSRVRVSIQHRHVEGEALDVDSDGALLVRTDSGIVQRVTSGDVTRCR